jgi:tellurite resistance protein
MKPDKTLKPLLDALLARLPVGDEGLVAVVDLAVLVAMADGKFDDAERAVVTSSIETIVGGRLSRSVLQHLTSESRAQLRALGPDASARRIGELLAASGCAEEGLRVALAVAWSSDGLADVERARIVQVAEGAGLTAERVDELVAETWPDDA